MINLNVKDIKVKAINLFNKVKSFFITSFKSNNFKTFFWVYLFITLPLVLNNLFLSLRIRTPLFLGLALCFPIFLFTKKIKNYLVFIFFFIWIPYFLNIFHYFIYQIPLHKGGVLAILETTPTEAFGFIKHFITIESAILLFVIVAVLFFYTRLRINSIDRTAKNFFFWQKIFFVLFLWSCLENRWSVYETRKRTIPFTIWSTYLDVRWELEAIRIKQKRNTDSFKNIKSIFGNQKQTFVIVIGESADRSHYSLYGYNRNTNPLLSKRKDLYLFNNVKSPHAQTLLSLKKVLTFASAENMDNLFNKGSIINYFKDAGFKTFWISNQENLSRHATFTSVISNEADVVYFNYDIGRRLKKGHTIDMDLKSFYKDALDDPANKKVIFLHFSGSHSPYEHRYTEEYAPFSDEKLNRIYKTPETIRKIEINKYDNSIFVNDLALNTYIDMLKKKNEVSYLLYFSDHGEDARDTSDSCFCHHDTHRNRKYMLNIPFITWVSDKYKNQRMSFVNGFNNKLSNPYNTEHFIHSVMSLSGLSNPDIDKTKSIFDK